MAGSAYFIDMGFAAMSWRLNVIFEYRKKGVAKQLIDEAKMRAKKRGFTQIQFVVHEEQERLRKWYQQQGAWSESLYRWMVFDL
ncbi:GNAT family N-acetyltransferase [Candidatus Pacearchaeota archaeon]|nr:GNAT family N-acetyltransferase [Candidatus Pacearchaeota archaeon]